MNQPINTKIPICLCDKCKAAMQESYYFELTGRRGGKCMNHPAQSGVEYYFAPKNMRRYKPRQQGLPQKDKRARYKGDWREDMK